jgi:hypothetical protein
VAPDMGATPITSIYDSSNHDNGNSRADYRILQ